MNKLVVISYDAMIQDDIKILKRFPNFKYLIENGSLVEDYRSIYPTLTYVCHTTMATGCYPDRHGIINNQIFNSDDVDHKKNDSWQFFHHDLGVQDIFELFKEAGLSTASVGWPVTGNHPFIDWEVDEIWPTGIDKGKTDFDTWRNAYIGSGTTKELFEEVVSKVLWMRQKRQQPDSSHFLIRVASEIIRKHRPDLMMIHEGHIDGFRHTTGVYSEKVEEGLADCDSMLDSLITAVKDADQFENTNFVITSDHGQLPIARKVYLNYLLREKNFINTDETDKITDWKAYVVPVGMSAQVYLKDSSDTSLYNQVYFLLLDLKNSGLFGIEKVYTKEEAQKEHLDGDFSFVLESDGFTEFCNGLAKGYMYNFPVNQATLDHASHGYHPSKGPTPVFIGMGPGFKKGKSTQRASLIDAAPTFASLFGLQFPDADGKPISEILAD